LFDKHFRGGMPWQNFPQSWANNLHEEYQLRLEELHGEADGDMLADQQGLMAAIEDALACHTHPDELQEIIDSNADLVARCSDENQATITAMYEAAKERKYDAEG
jgi:hypothetical protein